MKKRLWSILLTACLLMGLLPTAALAAGNVSYLDVEGKTQTRSATEVTSGSTTWPNGWYVVQGSVTITGDAAPLTCAASMVHYGRVTPAQACILPAQVSQPAHPAPDALAGWLLAVSAGCAGWLQAGSPQVTGSAGTASRWWPARASAASACAARSPARSC